MPLLRNKFQPYFPDPDSPNNYQCGSERYCHPVQIGDTVYSQFYQTPCNDNEVIDPEFDDYTLGGEEVLNGDFNVNPSGTWTIGTGWAWDAGNNEMDFTPGTVGLLYQQIPTLVLYEFYQVSFDLTRTAGSVQVGFGIGSGSNYSPAIDTTGSYTFLLQFNDSDVGNDIITVLPSIDFNGSITNISVKLKTSTYWIPNASWILSDGQACHITGQAGNLVENVANYIDAGGYYKVKFTVTNATTGSLEVFASDDGTGPITANGQYTYWLNPTINGVLSIGAQLTFDGCISDLEVYKLRNDYTAEVVDSNGNNYDVSNSFSYYQDYVTLGFQFDDYELAEGCYTLNVNDYCIITSNNLVINGDFVNGFDNWTKTNAGNPQYSITSSELTFLFDPFSLGSTDYITNGDFSSGAAWTINPGWSVAGGKAIHTPGNTGTMFQTLTLPTAPLGTFYNYYVKFTVTNWTAGTINLKIGTDPIGTNYTWKGNDVFFQRYQPRQSGSVNIVFTPSSAFDGEIDDVACVLTNSVVFPILKNDTNPLITPGTYQTEWEIVGSSDPNISVRAFLNSGNPNPNYESAVGTYSYTQAYNLTGGSVSIIANFSKTSPNYTQANYIIGDITVDNISLVKIEPFEATYTSECLQYSQNEIPRTKMIVGWCDQNALGFEFAQSGFKLQQRAEVRSIAPVYPKTTNIMKMGTGNAKIAYSEIEKYWQLHTGFASETFHDSMAVIISCDHFQIGDTEGDGVEYVAEAEDYTPNWQGDGSYTLATAVVNLRVKEKGQVFNRHI